MTTTQTPDPNPSADFSRYFGPVREIKHRAIYHKSRPTKKQKTGRIRLQKKSRRINRRKDAA